MNESDPSACALGMAQPPSHVVVPALVLFVSVTLRAFSETVATAPVPCASVTVMFAGTIEEYAGSAGLG